MDELTVTEVLEAVGALRLWRDGRIGEFARFVGDTEDPRRALVALVSASVTLIEALLPPFKGDFGDLLDNFTRATVNYADTEAQG